MINLDQRQAENNDYTKTAAAASSKIYCGMVKHILLLIFTCGIWELIWTYRVTDYTNAAEGEEYRNPTKKLLLCIFVPFYKVYWTYKTAQRVEKMAVTKGISADSELAILCLIMAIFVAILPPILLQDKINDILTADDVQPVFYFKEAAAPTETRMDTADEIKKYKELLDSGAITQEEYDAKKKQLLGL